MSRAVRHGSTKTTEAYCARLPSKAAFRNLRERYAPEVARIAFSHG